MQLQVGPPVVEDVPMVQVETLALRPLKRLWEKTPFETLATGYKRSLEAIPEERDRGGDVEMGLLETLEPEARVVETTFQEETEDHIRLENGWQWAPKSRVMKSGIKEMQELVDKKA